MAISQETKELFRDCMLMPIEDIGNRACSALLLYVLGDFDDSKKVELCADALSDILSKCSNYREALDDTLEKM